MLEDQSRFFLHWRLNATIQGVLNDADAIHERFQNIEGFFTLVWLMNLSWQSLSICCRWSTSVCRMISAIKMNAWCRLHGVRDIQGSSGSRTPERAFPDRYAAA
jgi:hypothetical protein